MPPCRKVTIAQCYDIRGSDKGYGHFQVVPEVQIRVRVGPKMEIQRRMMLLMIGNGKSRLGLGLGLDLVTALTKTHCCAIPSAAAGSGEVGDFATGWHNDDLS